MNRIIGLCTVDGNRSVLVQENGKLSLKPYTADHRVTPVCVLLEKRDTMIGNGPTRGEGVFDFRYGPFTGGYPEAGIIHYYTYGERILSVEIDTSVKHRGIEKSLIRFSPMEAANIAGRVCGNFTVAHALAFSRAVESALDLTVAEEDQRLRLAALEFERLYNHVSVLAGLASAAAQKVLAAHLFGLFEEVLRLTELFSGVRRMAHCVVPGGIALQPAEGSASIRSRIEKFRKQFVLLYKRSLSSRNYLDRLHNTAVVSRDLADRNSLTGPSLRAVGTAEDLRTDEPLLSGFIPRTKNEGDAFARMEVRAEEVFDSCDILLDQLTKVTPGQNNPQTVETAAGQGVGVGSAESAAGTVGWVVSLPDGAVDYAYTSTPSIFGLQTYADAVVGNIFTDVPFAIESFGVSFADAGR